MFWCTSSGLVFFPDCLPSANALNKKLFFLFLNLKEVRTGKAQPLVAHILRSVKPPTVEADNKLLAGDEQRDEWFIVDDNIQIVKACFTESKDDVILGVDRIPMNLCSSSSDNNIDILVHPPFSQKSSEHSCLLALGLFRESELDIWRQQSLNGLMIIRPDVKDHLMECGNRIPAPFKFVNKDTIIVKTFWKFPMHYVKFNFQGNSLLENGKSCYSILLKKLVVALKFLYFLIVLSFSSNSFC